MLIYLNLFILVSFPCHQPSFNPFLFTSSLQLLSVEYTHIYGQLFRNHLLWHSLPWVNSLIRTNIPFLNTPSSTQASYPFYRDNYTPEAITTQTFFHGSGLMLRVGLGSGAGADPTFSYGGGGGRGAQKIMCAHRTPQARSSKSLTARVRSRLRALESLGLLMLSHAYLSLIF